ncbi:cytochrome P450 [Planktothrix sp. FACHB-1355]|uniref:Cytochrome P450 n=1 Tax=Aerosakkonema funiforme FACHB-1375 TaxID=2949571 RepID=A0A926VCB5_9CYAN|nr:MULTISPECIES: cytochrome P450 [Oscillatoriales]MBD2181246.1 cytochrome P450 [Aerosakkonema funiforme FACHB-1375]MBD3562719.1 cytochrome P450 [Planktothrix sp. FACHB-1355]
MSQDLFELPGPEGNTIVGNLAELGQDPLGFLTKCTREYGDIVPLRLGLTPACLLTQPEYIEQVLKERILFIKSKGIRALRSFIGEGLLSSEGDWWQHQRRLIQPVFSHKRIAGYGQIMVAYAERAIDTWQDGETRDIHDEMMQLTLNIVMKCLFNQDITEGEAKNVAYAIDVAMHWFENKRKQGFFIWEWFPRPENIRYKNAIQQMDKSIYHLIEERRTSGEDTGDLLSMLMQVKDEEDGSQMTDKQLRDETITLMLAGHETTANTLSWTWMLLSQHPEVRSKLQAELKEVLDSRSATVADLPKLRYTEMIIKEAMRLYPPVPIMTREATQDCEIGGYEVPAGCQVMMSQWVMHRNPRYFEDPEVFQPERWANDLEKQLPRGVYFPFGDGPRTCIGKGFAMMEAVLLLATIAQKFEVNVVQDYAIVPQPSITLRPEYGIKVTLKKS